MKSICLVVVNGGVADAYHPQHVDCRKVDLDNVRCGDAPPCLPPGIGYEELVAEAGLALGVDFVWEVAE